MKSFVFYSIMAIMLQLFSNSLVFGEYNDEDIPYIMVINSNNASNDRKALAQVYLDAPYEYEGEIEPVDRQIKNYQGFIRQFPNSEFVPEALVNIAWLDLYLLQNKLSPKETKSRLARVRFCYQEIYDKYSDKNWGKTAKEIYDVLLKDKNSVNDIDFSKISQLHDRLFEQIPLCSKGKEFILKETDFVFKLEQCKCSYRKIRGDVIACVDLAYESIAYNILEKAAQFAIQKCPCPEAGFSNIDVALYKNNVIIISASNYHDKKHIAWNIYNNHATEEYNNREKMKSDRQKFYADITTLHAKLEYINSRDSDSNDKYSNFISKNQINIFPSYDELIINPYIYKEKVIGIQASFIEMLSETDGLMDFKGRFRFILSNIPTNMFSRRTDVLLAVKVIGKTPDQTLNVAFIDSYLCQEEDCNDLFFWRHAGEDREWINREIKDRQQRIVQSEKEEIDIYFDSIREIIRLNMERIFHVPDAVERKYTANATVVFKLDQNGHYSELALDSSSGYIEFRNALIDAFKSIEMFPSFSVALPKQSLKVRLTLSTKPIGQFGGSRENSSKWQYSLIN